MNLQCRKCGEQIEVPDEALTTERPGDPPRVTCPGCSTRFQLRPRQASDDPGATDSHAVGGPDEDTDVGPGEGSDDGPDDDPSRPIFEPGRLVAERYRIVRFIAQGGMGEVYEAEDVELRQEVALKTISARMGEESGILDRFKREIALARTVTHPNVCRIFDLGAHRGDGPQVNFLTMELLRGETLSELLRRRHRLSTAEALPLIEQMCAGLDAAHRARVVHRDLKSENVFLEGSSQARSLADCRVVLTDFGVARGTDAGDRFASRVTGLGIVGTPAYMAPEQVENKVITSRADLYSLGILIYEMVTGCLPFDAESPLTTAVKRLREPPPPPHVHVPDLPAWWERAILRCLERRPDDRFPDALSVVRALEKPVRRTRSGGAAGTAGPAPKAAARRTTNRPPDSQTSSAPATARHAAASEAASTADETRGPTTSATARPATSATVHPTTSATVPPARGERSETAGGESTLHGVAMGAAAPSGVRRRSLLAAVVLVALTLAGTAWLLWRPGEPAFDPARAEIRPTVTVLGFDERSGGPGLDWLPTAAAVRIRHDLSRAPTLRVVPGDRSDEARADAGLDRLHPLDPGALLRLRSLLDTDFVVSGVVLPGAEGGPGALRLEGRLYDASSGETLAAFAETGRADDLTAWTDAISKALRPGLGTHPPDPTEAAASGMPRAPDVVRLHARGLDALRAGDAVRAQELLQKAVAAEPGRAVLHAALADAWAAQGHTQRAAEAARWAMDLSSILPPDVQLQREARYRALAGEWDAAADLYAGLWHRLPDRLDFALARVDAQLAAGRVDEAQTSLGQARLLPPPLGNDPRLDLAEARAAARAGRAQQRLEAAGRAAAQAEAAGAGHVQARALLASSDALRDLGRAREAAAAAVAARRLLDSAGSPRETAQADAALARARLDQGDAAGARRAFESAVGLYRDAGDFRGLAATLGDLADLLRAQGRLRPAAQRLEERARVQEELADALGLADTLRRLAEVHLARDRLDRALEILESAPPDGRTADGLTADARAAHLELTAEVLRRRGDLDGARELYLAALESHDGPAARRGTLARLAGLLLDRGEVETAAARLQEAADPEPGTDPLGDAGAAATPSTAEADRRFGLGELARLRGEFGESAGHHEAALRLREAAGDRGGVLASRLALARLDLDTGLPARAELLAREVWDDAREDGRRAEAARARAVLMEALLDDQRLEEAAEVWDDDAGADGGAGGGSGHEADQTDQASQTDQADQADRAGEPSNVQSLGARLELDLARVRLDAARLDERVDEVARDEAEAVSDAFGALAAQAAEHGLRPLAMRIRLHQTAFAFRHGVRRDELVGRLRLLETEARAAGLTFFADRAKVLLDFQA